jgi:hypothetical protein
MPSNPKQGQLASLIISIIILIIVIILIVIVCCNYNSSSSNTSNTQPYLQNPQRAAALGAGAYKYNQNKNNFGQTMTCTKGKIGDICGRDGLGTPTAWCDSYKGQVQCTGFAVGHT